MGRIRAVSDTHSIRSAGQFRARLIDTVDRADPGDITYSIDAEAIADAVLTDLEPVRELLLAQAISASAATRGNWNDSPAEVLEAQGLSPDIIDWVLAGSEHATR